MAEPIFTDEPVGAADHSTTTSVDNGDADMVSVDTNVDGIFNIKDQSAYLGGYVAVGVFAIVQTIAPLLIYQLWRKPDITTDNRNMWYKYAWQAMQAGGVVSWGLPALAFLASFMFDLNLLERLGLLMLGFTHIGLLGCLTVITVISYLVVALIKYEDSMFSAMWEIGVTLAVYLVF